MALSNTGLHFSSFLACVKIQPPEGGKIGIGESFQPKFLTVTVKRCTVDMRH
jgi:hypothetical protein